MIQQRKKQSNVVQSVHPPCYLVMFVMTCLPILPMAAHYSLSLLFAENRIKFNIRKCFPSAKLLLIQQHSFYEI